MSDDRQEISVLYSQGLDCYQRGEYEKALALLQRVAAVDPSYRRVSRYLRACQTSIGGDEASGLQPPASGISESITPGPDTSAGATQIFSQTGPTGPTEEEMQALYEKGLHWIQEERFQDALDCLEKVVSASPGYRRADRYLTLAREGLSKKEEPISVQPPEEPLPEEPYGETLAEDQAIPDGTGQGDSAPEGDQAGAPAETSQPPEDGPVDVAPPSDAQPIQREEDVHALYQKGLQFVQNERFQEALECLEEVDRLSPGYRRVERYLPLAREGVAKAKEAPQAEPVEEISEQDTGSSPSCEPATEETVPPEMSGSGDKTVMFGGVMPPPTLEAKERIGLSEDETQSLYQRGLQLIQEERYKEALECLEKVQEAFPNYRRTARYIGLAKDGVTKAVQQSEAQVQPQELSADAAMQMPAANAVVETPKKPVSPPVAPPVIESPPVPHEPTQLLKTSEPQERSGSKVPIFAGIGVVLLLVIAVGVMVLSKSKPSGAGASPTPTVKAAKASPPAGAETRGTPRKPVAVQAPTQDPRVKVIEEAVASAGQLWTEGKLSEAREKLAALSDQERQRQDVVALVAKIDQREKELKDTKTAEEAEAKVSGWVADAKKALEGKRWSEAISLAEKALVVKPDLSEAKQILTSARDGQGQSDAEKKFQEAVRLAKAGLAAKDADAAEGHLRTAKGLRTDAPEVQDLSAQIAKLREENAKRQEQEKAEKERAARIAKLENQAQEQHQAGRIEEAKATVKELLDLDSQNAMAFRVKQEIEKAEQKPVAEPVQPNVPAQPTDPKQASKDKALQAFQQRQYEEAARILKEDPGWVDSDADVNAQLYKCFHNMAYLKLKADDPEGAATLFGEAYDLAKSSEARENRDLAKSLKGTKQGSSLLYQTSLKNLKLKE